MRQKYLTTDEAAQLEVHKNSVKQQLLPMAGKSPNYQFEFGDLQNF